MIMEFLRIVTVAAFAYATAVLPTNSLVVLVVAALAVAAISHALFPTDVRLTQAQKLQRARLALAATAGSSTYNLADHLHAGLNAEGAIELRLALTPALHNFLGSMHGGAIASAVDVATTIAIIADGGYPGVSTSLGCTYLNGCAPDEVVRLVPTVLRRGANLTYTECKLYRADGVLMARGWHVKYTSAPRLVQPLLALRPSLVQYLLARLAVWGGTVRLDGRTVRLPNASSRAPSSTADACADASRAAVPTAKGVPFDAAVEPDTGLPRTEAGKREYFARSGAAGLPMQGWDGPLRAHLTLVRSGGRSGGGSGGGSSGGGGVGSGADLHGEARAATTSCWTLDVTGAHTNSFHTLHGGCSASLVDVLGTAAVAFDDPVECGVAATLDVQYLSTARLGEQVHWEAEVLKRGGRLVTVEVRGSIVERAKAGRPEKTRLVVVGTVTKSMRGLSTKAGAS
eukprot:jgi/Chrpa1/19781/Chrysochromulina_OHIO_Genome00025071-RA